MTAAAPAAQRERVRSATGRVGRDLGVHAAAFLAGASGLGLEALLIPAAGPAVGQGAAGALGLTTFLFAWALGARQAGRSAARPVRVLPGLGLAVLVAAVLAPRAVLAAAGLPDGAAHVLALGAVAAVALPQGAFLPFLARVRGPESGVAALFAANLLGAVVGAFLFAETLVGLFGRPPAALAAGAAALAAGLLGALAARTGAGSGEVRTGPPGGPGEERGPAGAAFLPPREGADHGLDPRVAGLVLGLGTAWLSGLQWIGLRLGVLWLGGMQHALAAVLAAALIALALGAALLPPLLARGARGVEQLLALALIATTWPFVAASALRGLGLDDPDAAADALAPLATALVLVGPALLPFGALVPVLHRAQRGESGARLGRLLAHEAWGVLLGVPLLHVLLVPRVGLGGSLAALLGLGAVLVAATAFGARPPAGRRVWRRGPALALAVLAALGAFGLARAPEPALAAPPFADPALELLAFEEDADFAVAVVDDGLRGERTLLTDGFRAAGTGADYRYMRVLGHLPLLLHPAPERVAVLALGTGTTLGAVSLHPEVRAIDVLEISPAVARQARFFEAVNHGALERDPRVRLELGDGRRALAGKRASYDVITMEPLLPDAPFGVPLYTDGFYAVARRALAPGGILCQWVPPHALAPETFRAVLDAFRRALPWSEAWQLGTQVILVGGEARPALEPARFPAAAGGDGGADEARLARALAELGLASPAALVARRVADLDRLPPVPRPLTDADPWILYRAPRTGLERLADLPRNLDFLARHESPLPGAWRAALTRAGGAGGDGPPQDDAALARVAGGRALRAAHLGHAAAEARARGAPLALDAPDPDRALADAARLAGPDPEADALDLERRFLAALRAGVGALRAGGEGSAQAALGSLVTAAELRPARADAHLYLAVALQRAGSAAAARAFATARELCPRVLETPPGARALELGLAPARLAPELAAAPR